MSCEAPTALTVRVFVNAKSWEGKSGRVGEGPRSTLSAELLSRWGEGLRSLGVEAEPALCPHFLAVGPAVPVTEARAPGQQSSPRRERALPPKTGPAL